MREFIQCQDGTLLSTADVESFEVDDNVDLETAAMVYRKIRKKTPGFNHGDELL